MSHILPTTVLRTAALSCAVLAFGLLPAASPEETLRAFRAPAGCVGNARPGFVLVEAESFADYGGWAIDTQFVHVMGSAYLISKGVLRPAAPASTRVTVPTAGRWRAWVRTKDWLPEFSPGRFALQVGERRSPDLGASGKAGWRWERAGDYDLAAGETNLALVDLSGGFARCDAVLLTLDPGYEPPDGGPELDAERCRFKGADPEAADGGAYDVVVVGAGPGGLAAALAAARNGARTLLLHDRPVLGGNSGIEQHTNIGGASSWNRSRGAVDMREGGIVEESRLLRFKDGGISTSAAYRLMVDAESNLVERANLRAVDAECVGGRVLSVTAVDTLAGTRVRYRGKAFVDGTGDGWIGQFAGAELMYGREARAVYGEPDAPEKPDELTMSGSVDDYVWHFTGRDEPFDPPPWVKVLPPGFNRPDVNGLQARWWLEHPGTFDDLKDPERARDELLRINLDYWAWLRRHPQFGARARQSSLDEVKFHNGRREGWRLRGDYVLTSLDCAAGRTFEDAVSYGGWGLDLHDPLGVMNPAGNGWWSNRPTGHYQIPYRCLYSRNVMNLFMAGRNVSVSHAALGSVRIMGTLFTLGQAAGTAAQMAAAENLTAREIGQRHFKRLQQRLIRDDLFLPGVPNEDPADLARTARVTASSARTRYVYARSDPDFFGAPKYCDRRLGLAPGGWTCFPRCNLDRLKSVSCLLENRRQPGEEVVMDVYDADEMAGPPATRTHRGTAKATVGFRGHGFVDFALASPLRLTRRYVWLRLQSHEGVVWILRQHVFGEGGGVAQGGADENLRPNILSQVAFVTEPVRIGAIDAKPEYVIDGFARRDPSPLDGVSTHAWHADPEQPMPQWIQLDFPAEVTASEVRVTFDSGLVYEIPEPTTLVKDYAVLVKSDGRWQEVVAVRGNLLRLVRHRFAPRKVSAVRVRVDGTHGTEPRIQEIRVY